MTKRKQYPPLAPIGGRVVPCWFCSLPAVKWITKDGCGFGACNDREHWDTTKFKSWMAANDGRIEITACTENQNVLHGQMWLSA